MTRPQIVVRLGAGLALRWDRQHAWRAVVVSVAVFLSSFCLLVTLACVKAASEAGDRTTARTPMVIDTSDRVADGLTMVERGPIWHGYQVPVVWLEPGESSTLVPPGLRKIPDPGTVAISPGLEAAGFRKDSLGLTVGDAGSGERGTIGLEGLGSASEFLVYARPAVGRQLGSDGVRYTIKSFGIPPGFSRSADPSREAFPWRLETDPPAPSPLREGLTVGLLIALPCFMLLWAAGGALSGTRDARLRALDRLGIGRGVRRAIGAVETAVFAVPAAAAGGLTGWLWLRHLAGLPARGLTYEPGMLAVTGAESLGVSALTAAVAVAFGARIAQARVRHLRGRSGRRTGTSASRGALAALMVGLTALALSRFWSSPPMLAIGMVVVAVALPFSIPAIVRIAAQALPVRGPSWWLATRRVVANPVGLSRPAAAVALLIFTLVGATGIQAKMMEPVAGANDGTPVARLTWRGAQPSDVTRLISAAGSARVRGTPSGPGAPIGSVEVSGSPTEIDRVHALANGMFAAPMLLGGPALRFHLGSSWLAPIIVLAMLLLLIGALILLGNRALSLVQEDVGMLRSGIGLDEVTSVQRKELALPVGVAIALGTGCGLVLLWAGALLDVTETPYKWILAGVVTATALCAALVWFVASLAVVNRVLDDGRGHF